MSLKVTRKIIDAIHSGELEKGEFQNMPIFNFAVPTACSGVDANILLPRNTWENKEAYDAEISNLAAMFQKNFKKYQDKATEEVVNAGPVL